MISIHQIAWRFLGARKRFFGLTVSGVALGVGLFIVAQTQVVHLENLFVETVLGANGAIQVKKCDSQSIFEHGHLAPNATVGHLPKNSVPSAMQSFKGVQSATEVLEGEADLIHGFYSGAVQLYGIEARDYFATSGFEKKLLYGKVNDFLEEPYGLLIGATLAQKIGLSVGDSVDIASGEERLAYKVIGIYQTGLSDIDASRLYLHLGEVRKILHKPYGNSHVQLSLFRPQAADHLAEQIEASLGYAALSWREREKLWLSLFQWMRWVALLLVAMVIAVAGLGIFNNLTLLILQKERDIAILRAMGYAPQKIRQIFSLQGLMVYGIGLMGGILLGFLGNEMLRVFPLIMDGLFQVPPAAKSLNPDSVLLAALWVGLVVFFACYLPARRASCMDPGKIIRSAAS